MTNMNLRWLFFFGLVLALAGAVFAAPEDELVPLADAELEAVCAAGLNITLNLGVDLSTANPSDLIVVSPNNLSSLQPLAGATQQPSASGSGSFSTGGIIDMDGTMLPDFQSVINNNVSISDNALQNAQSLLNIISLGDVAVGINITIIVEPTNSTFNTTQANVNWSDLMAIPSPAMP